MDDKLNTVASASAGLVMRPTAAETMEAHGRYRVECLDAAGNVKWSDDFDNLVVNAGKNEMLDKYLSGSSWSTGTIYMGLVNGGTTPTYAAGDTMSSHAGWTELTAVTANRGTVTFAAASGGAKATSSNVAFSITGSATVAGVFLVVGGTSANGNTTGTLFSAGNFSGGNRAVVNGDTLNVSYSISV
jgi:hypothetical protein